MEFSDKYALNKCLASLFQPYKNNERYEAVAFLLMSVELIINMNKAIKIANLVH